MIRIRESNGRHTIISKSTLHNGQGYTAIGTAESSIDISLFHEMTHWYHYLRNPKKFTEEADKNRFVISLQLHPLWMCYWAGLTQNEERDPNRKDVSILYWTNLEELRTILGGTKTIENNVYVEGDDLSENLYRMCIGAPIRFGHSNLGFYEDVKVANNVINALIENYENYIKGYIPPLTIMNTTRQGLGNCRK